jgi:hypothetical protein
MVSSDLPAGAYMRFMWKFLWLIVGAGIAYLAAEQWPKDSGRTKTPNDCTSDNYTPDAAT